MRNRLFHLLPFASLLVFLANPLFGASPKATIETYEHSDGATYFVLGIQAPVVPSTAPKEVVLLLSTAAGQTGEIRKDSLSALDKTIAGLPRGTKVKLYALDSAADPYTDKFETVGSPQFTSALNDLKKRNPLSATDMKQGLKDIRQAFADGAPGAERSVIYIGDGNSAADWMDESDFAKTTSEYVKDRITFSSYVNGLNPDVAFLGAMANQTGGIVIDGGLVPEEAGAELARSVSATVCRPDQDTVRIPREWDYCLPAVMPPVRSDRETILVGKTTKNIRETQLSFSGRTGSKIVDMSWDAVPYKGEVSSDYNHFLVNIFDRAAKDDGLSMPIAGRDILDRFRIGLINEGMKINTAAKVAMQRGDEVSLGHMTNALSNSERGSTMIGNQFESGVNGPNPKSQTTFTETVSVMHDIKTKSVGADVNNTINEARRNVGTLPEIALQDLKLKAVQVRDDMTLSSVARNDYLSKLENAIKETERQVYINDFRRQKAEQHLAVWETRNEMLNGIIQSEKKVKELLERYTKLMADGEHKIAEQVADIAAVQLPTSSTPIIASLEARTRAYIKEYNRLRHLRSLGFVDAFMMVEQSNIPASDEPPLIYPRPEVWIPLTQRRKDRYSSADLQSRSAAEKEILEALDSDLVTYPGDEYFSFDETDLPTLGEFVRQLELYYRTNNIKAFEKMSIDFDHKAMEEVGTETPLLSLPKKGWKLRTVLKRVLTDLSLVSCIADDMILITDEDTLNKNYMVIKVYPVGDLVVSPQSGGGNNNNNNNYGNNNNRNNNNSNRNNNRNNNRNWNVPSIRGAAAAFEQLQNGVQNNGFSGNFFSVVDREASEDARTNNTAASASAAPALPVAGPAPNSNVLVLKEGDINPVTKKIYRERFVFPKTSPADRDAYWDEYFQKNETAPSALSKAVSLHMSGLDRNPGKVKDIIAVIGSVLRNGTPEPWMYEVLAAMMKKDGAPKKEIERVLLSSVDLNDTSGQIYTTARFLEEMGMFERAFVLYRQTYELEPDHPMPIYYVMELAQHLDNEEMARWAVVSAASNVWQGKSKEMLAGCELLAEQVMEKMRKTGRTEDLLAFQKELKDASAKDCILEVTWAGEAGLDLTVKEPSDTYCCYANWLSPSGGHLQKTLFDPTATGSSKLSENKLTYICPKGFSGEYLAMIERSWGKVIGEVAVTLKKRDENGEIKFETRYLSFPEAHEGSYEILDKKTGEKKQIFRNNDKIIVLFDIENGRRTDPVESEVLELSLARQALPSQGEIRKFLYDFTDKGIRAALAESPAIANVVSGGATKSITGGTGGDGGGGGWDDYADYFPWAFARRGVVGYQPVVETIPEGAELYVDSTIISADRRYVRVSPTPTFSQIQDIFVYRMYGDNAQTVTTTN